MADCFLPEDATKLLLNKYVVFIGSSGIIMRSMYKDFVKLLQKSVWLSDSELRSKGENSFQGDELLEGGKKMQISNGIQYREVRQYCTHYVLVRFYFITRCYNKYVESVFRELEKEPKPDLILFNSGLWDLTRYGANPVPTFKKTLTTAFTRLTEVIPGDCLLLWVTCMPISEVAKGGVFVPEVEHLKSLVRLELLQANAFSAELASSFGFDVLDLCYFFRNHLHRIAEDGIHWDMTAHRRFTNLILSHVSEAWGVPLPGRAVEAETLKDMKQLSALRRSENGQNAERKIKTGVRRRLPQNQKCEKDENQGDDNDDGAENNDDEDDKPDAAGGAIKVDDTDIYDQSEKAGKCDTTDKRDKDVKADKVEKEEKSNKDKKAGNGERAKKDDKAKKNVNSSKNKKTSIDGKTSKTGKTSEDENASRRVKASKGKETKKGDKTDRCNNAVKTSYSITDDRSKSMQNKSPVRFFSFEYHCDQKNRLLTPKPRIAKGTEHAYLEQSCQKLNRNSSQGKSIVDDVSEALHSGSGFAVHSRQLNRRQRQVSAETPRRGAFSAVGKAIKMPTVTDLRSRIYGRSDAKGGGYGGGLTMDSEQSYVHKHRLG